MFENREKRTELSNLGEFGLIHKLTKDLNIKNPTTLYGVGDDAALLDSLGRKILISTDLLIEGVHFDLSYVPLKHLGYKSAVVNFSDIAAMNAKPSQITVSLALSNRFSLEAIEELYAGIKLACDKYSVDLVGGDTTSSRSGLVISVTVIGYEDSEKVVFRNGAKETDLICVSGDLGAAYAGLLILEREKSGFVANPDMQPDLEGNDYILERQLKPEARIDIVDILEKEGIRPTAMMDVSDGLASELKHICSQSNVGCTIYEEKIPIDQTTFNTARDFNIDPTTCAMNGGEDYELLFTAPITDFDKLKNIPEISIIGHITDQNSGLQLVTKNGVTSPISAQGWDGLK